MVLSAFVVHAGEAVSKEALADALWGDRAPATWSKVVQGCVMRLRRRLGAAAIESAAFGYRLTVSDDELDHRLFERLLELAREALAGGDPARSSYLVKESLDLWRGRALVELEEWEPGRVEAARLEGLRMDAEELRVEAEIAAGRATVVLEQARTLTARAPFREHRWALLATALYQVGRQPEALGALKRARAMLVDELGLDPGRELVELEQQLLRQDPVLTPPVWREVSVVCPYRGLLPYDAEHADAFFGREDDVAACLERLRASGAVTVAGPSGVGKSSLVRAGVVAALVRTRTPVLVTTPGAHPVDTLSGLRPGGLQTLVVDQAEEAVTVCRDVAERGRYFTALAGHVHAGGALVLSVRADHLGDLAAYPDIARIVEDGLLLLGPMSEPHLRSAIEGPARRAGLRLEPGLVDLLVREVEDEPGALPLLSHVLRETWQRREGPTLTVAGYRSTGGIRGAVSQTAETLYDGMDEVQRGQLRSLLLRLVMPTEDGEPVRARVPRAQVAGDDAHSRLVEQLVGARLVSIDGDTVQIAHEAMVRAWPRLRGWLDDDIDGQRVLRHLAGAADAWEGLGRSDSELYRGARLSRALEWRTRATPDLTGTEAAFLDASTALSETEQRAAEARLAHERTVNRRFRTALVGVCALVVLALVAGLVAVRISGRAQQDRSAASLAEGSRRASAQALLSDDVATSLLFSVAAVRSDPSPEAMDALGTGLARTPQLVAVRDTGGSVQSPLTSPDGKLLAVASPAAGVRLFDASSLAPIPFADHTPASSVTFSPDGRLMAMTAWTDPGPRLDGRLVRLYDLPSLAPSARQLGGLPQLGAIDHVAFNRSGTRVAAVVVRASSPTDWTGAEATVWDLAHPSTPIFQSPVEWDASVTLSPDGRSLYAVTPGGRPLQMFDVDTRSAVRAADFAPLDGVSAADIDVSPDGSTLAVAAADVIYRFDTRTLKPRGAALSGPTDAVTDMQYSHDGTLLLSASADQSVAVWDAASNKPVQRFDVQAGVTGATFAADDRTVYSSSADGRVMAWDLTGQRGVLAPTTSRPAVDAPYRWSLLAPDGHTVVRAKADTMWVVDTRTGRTTPPTSTAGTDHFVWSPDSRWLLSMGADQDNEGNARLVKLWDATSGQVVGTRAFRSGHTFRVAFDPTSHAVYVADGAGILFTFDRAALAGDVLAPDLGGTGARGAMLVDGDIAALVPHPRDGSVLVLRSDGSFAQVDPDTRSTLAQAPPGTMAADGPTPVFSPSGTVMAAARPDGVVGLVNVDTLQWVGRGPAVTRGGSATFAPDGSQFALVQEGRIRFWDGRTGAYQGSVPLPNPAEQVTISYTSGGSDLLAASTDGRTWVVDTRTGTWIERACAIAGRNLTQREWSRLFPDRPYEVICPRWPAGT